MSSLKKKQSASRNHTTQPPSGFDTDFGFQPLGFWAERVIKNVARKRKTRSWEVQDD